jgi:hypothetical protein
MTAALRAGNEEERLREALAESRLERAMDLTGEIEERWRAETPVFQHPE